MQKITLTALLFSLTSCMLVPVTYSPPSGISLEEQHDDVRFCNNYADQVALATTASYASGYEFAKRRDEALGKCLTGFGYTAHRGG